MHSVMGAKLHFCSAVKLVFSSGAGLRLGSNRMSGQGCPGASLEVATSQGLGARCEQKGTIAARDT